MPDPIIPQPVDQLKVLTKEPEAESEAPIQETPIAAKIPDSMWDPIEEDITTFVRDEIYQALAERSEFERKLARWRLVYDVPMPEGPKTFPFFGASNLTLPVVKEAVNTLVAQLVQATLTARPRWVLQDLAEEWEPFVDEIETFLDLASDRDMKINKTAVPWIIEAAKFGTSILEVGYEVIEREHFRITSDGKSVYPKNLVKHDGPITYNMALEDFLIRFGESDIQRARWCGKRLRLNETDIQDQERNGRFVKGTWKAIKGLAKETDIPEGKEVQEDIESTEPTERLEYAFYEIWLTYNLRAKENGAAPKMNEIVVYYSDALQKIVGRQFHPYWHGKRPFIKLGYFPAENRFYDQGLCEMLEQIQEAISSRYNQRSDNITLASLKIFLKRRGVKALQPGDPLYSGKVLEVLDVHNDIREMKISEIYPSTVNEELMLRDYGDRLAGTNEVTAGSAQPVSRTTASAQLALLQEQAKRIDLTVSAIRDGMNEVGSQGIDLYFQHGVNGKGIAWMGARGRTVEAVFRLPMRVVELGLAVRVQVPTSLQNRQVKRENSIAMFNLLVNLYQQMLPLAQGLAPEALPSVVQAMVKGSQKFLGDVLETFDISDPEEALAGLTVLERLLPRAEDMGGLESFARGTESAEILEKLSRLDTLLREAEALRSRDSGVPELSGDAPRLPPSTGSTRELDPGLLFGGEPQRS
ncbi:hypothetical protein LCGC14_0251650 [marine sediment metagenome]|uniref:Uncharacterized protein n=1 Tax=marine sediment metagenome TaxID=412755 RepID=A0A0F9X901_9ZZZZ